MAEAITQLILRYIQQVLSKESENGAKEEVRSSARV